MLQGNEAVFTLRCSAVRAQLSIFPAAMPAREMEKSASGAYYRPPIATGFD